MISLTIITSVLLQNALARHGSAFNEPADSDYGQGSILGRCHVGESSVKVGVHRLKDYKIVREEFLPPVKR